MIPNTWAFSAFPFLGDGASYPASATDLDLRDVKITQKLNAPTSITGDLVVNDELVVGGDLALGRWRTEVTATYGPVVAAGIQVNDPILRGAGATRLMQLDAMGHSGYMNDFPYPGEYYGIAVDPAALVRKVWADVQAYRVGDLGCNLGITVPMFTTPVRIGKKTTPVNFQTGLGEDIVFEEGPTKLTTWDVADCADFIAKLCTDTPMEYAENYSWSTEGVLGRKVVFAYPRMGRRRTDITFRTGEALRSWPEQDTGSGDEWANVLFAFGRGEGKVGLRTVVASGDPSWLPKQPEIWNPGASFPRRGLMRPQAWTDKTRASTSTLRSAALAELRKRRAPIHLTKLTLQDHPHAPIGSYQLGDEVLTTLDVGDNLTISAWVRVTGITWQPAKADIEVDVETL